MGWTWYHANHYKSNGSIDRKAECDAYFMEGLNAGHFEVLKSTMVGSVYYAAVRHLKRCTGKDESGKNIYEDIHDAPVWAAVFLTSTNSRDYYNFGYKDMEEDVGPGPADCPLSILRLLSPTDSKWAQEWRDRCKAKAEQPKLSALPIGTQIEFQCGDKIIACVKHAPAFQFSRPFWYNPANNTYIPARRIPSNYKIVEAVS